MPATPRIIIVYILPASKFLVPVPVAPVPVVPSPTVATVVPVGLVPLVTNRLAGPALISTKLVAPRKLTAEVIGKKPTGWLWLKLIVAAGFGKPNARCTNLILAFPVEGAAKSSGTSRPAGAKLTSLLIE